MRFISLSKKATARLVTILVAGGIALNANAAQAQTLTEDFEDPFASWENEWLGQNSNLQNYYVFYGSTTDTRGNNPDGLYIHDGTTTNGNDALILFDPAFGSTLTSISFDLAAYTSPTLTIFDIDGATLFTAILSPSLGFLTDPGVYTNYSAFSTNGIGGFSLFGGPAEGYTSIDNVVVSSVISAVPEPSTWAMMLLGFGAVGYSVRRRRKANGSALLAA